MNDERYERILNFYAYFFLFYNNFSMAGSTAICPKKYEFSNCMRSITVFTRNSSRKFGQSAQLAPIQEKVIKSEVVKQEYVEQQYAKEDFLTAYIKQETIKQENVKQEDIKQEYIGADNYTIATIKKERYVGLLVGCPGLKNRKIGITSDCKGRFLLFFDILCKIEKNKWALPSGALERHFGDGSAHSQSKVISF